jgi:hypothetical protein
MGVYWRIPMFVDKPPFSQRSGNLPPKSGYGFLDPLRNKYSKNPSPIISLKEDEKPLQKIEE